jgi:hypothetical protein
MDDIEAVRRRLARLAWLLDNSITLPGTRFRIGIDAILGLVPGLGDLLGVLASSYIVREAARVGAPPSVLTRMAFNVAVEGLVGLVPFFGDVFDAVWKANQRNYALLEEHIENPRRAARSSRAFVVLLITVLVAFIALTAVGAFLIVRLLVQAFS